MVHKHRNVKKATQAKDISPVRHAAYVHNKYANEQQLSGFGSRLIPSPVPARSAIGAEVDKWKYNNMVNNQRDNFNNLHFC